MTISRNVIIDLLPLYVAGEASAESRRLVDEFVREDPSLAALLRVLQRDRPEDGRTDGPPVDLERAAVNRTRVMIRRRSWTLGLAIFLTLAPLTSVYSGGQLMFFVLRDVPVSAALWVGAAYCWWLHSRLTRDLRTAGL
jgi:hypothetical protein